MIPNLLKKSELAKKQKKKITFLVILFVVLSIGISYAATFLLQRFELGASIEYVRTEFKALTVNEANFLTEPTKDGVALKYFDVDVNCTQVEINLPSEYDFDNTLVSVGFKSKDSSIPSEKIRMGIRYNDEWVQVGNIDEINNNPYEFNIRAGIKITLHVGLWVDYSVKETGVVSGDIIIYSRNRSNLASTLIKDLADRKSTVFLKGVIYEHKEADTLNAYTTCFYCNYNNFHYDGSNSGRDDTYVENGKTYIRDIVYRPVSGVDYTYAEFDGSIYYVAGLDSEDHLYLISRNYKATNLDSTSGGSSGPTWTQSTAGQVGIISPKVYLTVKSYSGLRYPEVYLKSDMKLTSTSSYYDSENYTTTVRFYWKCNDVRNIKKEKNEKYIDLSKVNYNYYSRINPDYNLGDNYDFRMIYSDIYESGWKYYYSVSAMYPTVSSNGNTLPESHSAIEYQTVSTNPTVATTYPVYYTGSGLTIGMYGVGEYRVDKYICNSSVDAYISPRYRDLIYRTDVVIPKEGLWYNQQLTRLFSEADGNKKGTDTKFVNHLVFVLNSNTYISGGDGSLNNPYKISPTSNIK